MLFWLLLASTLRFDTAMTCLNCSNLHSRLDGSILSIVLEGHQMNLFEHFLKDLLWCVNLRTSGFIDAGLEQKVIQNGTPLRQAK